MHLKIAGILCFCLLHLTIAKADTPINKNSFNIINLNYPGLEKVKHAVEAGKYNDAASALLQYYRHKIGEKKPDFSNLEIQVDTTGQVDAKSQETVNNAMLHRFKTQEAYGFFDFGKDINWKLWPVKDNEVRWQLHRVKWWLTMALVYHKTKNEAYAKEWTLQFADWANKNPLGLSADNDKFAWRPLEVSDRVQNLIPTVSIFINSPNFTPAFLMDFLKSYHQQADYLPSHYATDGNHRLFEAQRTLFAGASFPEFQDAAKWRKSGIEVLNAEIKKQVYPDGIQFELSPVYHAASIDIFVKALRGAQKAGIENEFPASYKQTVEKMVMAFINITFPNYNQPMFGDSWLAKKEFRLNQFSSWSAIFPDNKFIKYFATAGKAGEKPNWFSNALSTAGFYTFRNGWDEKSTIMILKASPPGEFHAQPDNGTFELWVNGRNFTPDAGCFVYSGDAEIMKQRNWFRQSRVHSTLTLNNQDMLITKAVQNKWETASPQPSPGGDGVSVILTYTNPSYTDLDHRRSVLFINQQYFLIIDQVMGKATGNLGTHFQLKEDSKPTVDQTGNKVFTNYTDGNNLLIQNFNTDKISLKEEEGKVSYAYQTEVTRPAFVFEKPKADEKSQSFISVVYPFNSHKTPNISIKENAGNNYDKGILNLIITIDGKTQTIKTSITQ
ncbi:heparin-sulfate lyase HepC [Pedobacter miscanthi]|jgi:heparan-sulfate lyase|uniref:heparin-sulfate lyase HepC n=1 Tax=Pedobacter miscanthi TaxID=2259170 RepID=UPI00292D2717|nr:heparin-sulfate lyase HepC [Pedobacter miscanthi]